MSTMSMNTSRFFLTANNTTSLRALQVRTTNGIRSMTTTATASKTSTSSSWRQRIFTSSNFRKFVKVVKYVRIPTLIMSVYSLGYTAGIADYMRSPRKFKVSLRNSILASVGCYDEHDEDGNGGVSDKVFIATEGEWKNPLSISSSTSYKKPGSTNNDTDRNGTSNSQAERELRHLQLQKFAYVSEKILDSARRLVVQELNSLHSQMQEITKNQQRGHSNTTTAQSELASSLSLMEQLHKWEIAYESLETDGDKWRFVLIHVPFENAFVTETTPYTIYLTTALLENIIANDDELALVLGHELSHLLLAHTSEAMKREGYLRAFEVLLLTMDPTEGLMSLLFMGIVRYIREIFKASYSRQNEHEADELGMKLAAMSCFDTRNASKVFKKMHDHHVEDHNQSETVVITSSSNSSSSSSSGQHRDTSINKEKGQEKGEVNVDSTSEKKQNTNKEGYELSSYTDTHPPTLLRYENLLKMSEEENPLKYSFECQNTRRRFLRALKIIE